MRLRELEVLEKVAQTAKLEVVLSESGLADHPQAAVTPGGPPGPFPATTDGDVPVRPAIHHDQDSWRPVISDRFRICSADPSPTGHGHAAFLSRQCGTHLPTWFQPQPAETTGISQCCLFNSRNSLCQCYHHPVTARPQAHYLAWPVDNRAADPVVMRLERATSDNPPLHESTPQALTSCAHITFLLAVSMVAFAS